MDTRGEEGFREVEHECCPKLPSGDLWVFGYGSLMWDPGFDYVRSQPALLRGYHRAFCVTSTRYRGTPERPGLVLGLDRGGSCRGIAFLVPDANVEPVLHALWEREMPGRVYSPRVVSIDLGGARASALTFVADRGQDGYMGRLEVDEMARTIADCSGARGPNADYLFNTLRHLDAAGIRERRLYALARAVQALQKPRTHTPERGCER
ncbi:MAG TPA: gamma-glutamylcyclotransferase [Burkholderiales bacterium]|nr:gamma-glutamylcyclotransferase [Burkholderiales bacterium]